MKRFILVACTLLALNSFATDPYPKNPKIDAQNYAFHIELSDNSDVIKMEVVIDILYKEDGVNNLRLDLVNAKDELDGKGMTVSSVMSEGRSLSFTHSENVLMISLPAPSTKNQRSSYVVKYSGEPATGLKIANNKHGDRTFFSDNWPNKGRNWLSTIDHPYDKAKCEFVVTAPNHYQVVSNGLLLEETDLGEGMKLTHWKQSVPIAPWLYVLGVAEFAVQYVDEFEGKSIQTWVYRQDRDAGFYDFAVPTKQALEFYSDYVGPFSYEKLANIQSNSVGGGMEAASAILYGDRSVTGQRSERWRNVVIHEVAHQWFGNSVTEYDWDDVWLSEGFATYFTLLFIEHQYGRDEFVKGLIASRNRVNDFHKKNPGYTIVHDNLKDMAKVTTGQTYQKGAWILHMLRGVVGTDNFWKGIQSYYLKYMDSHATTTDFRREMEAASGLNLESFFDQWLYKSGTIEIEGSWKYNSRNKEVTVEVTQVQTDPVLFTMPLEIGLKSKNGEIKYYKIGLEGKDSKATINVDSEPETLIVDPNTWLLIEGDINKK